jgi:hypothetical protein
MEPGVLAARATRTANPAGRASARRLRDDGNGRLPLRHPADAADVALGVCDFVLRDSTYVTGHRVVIDRGLTVTL